MNTNTNSNDRENNFETISLNKLKSKDLVGNHLLFYLLIINTIIALLLLTIIINPYKSTFKFMHILAQCCISTQDYPSISPETHLLYSHL